MLNHWEDLVPGVLLSIEKKANNYTSFQWALYIGDGKAWPLYVSRSSFGEDYVKMTLDPIMNLAEQVGSIYAFSTYKRNEPVSATGISDIVASTPQQRTDSYLIMRYFPVQEYTVEQLSKMLGRKVKIVGNKEAE